MGCWQGGTTISESLRRVRRFPPKRLRTSSPLSGLAKTRPIFPKYSFTQRRHDAGRCPTSFLSILRAAGSPRDTPESGPVFSFFFASFAHFAVQRIRNSEPLMNADGTRGSGRPRCAPFGCGYAAPSVRCVPWLNPLRTIPLLQVVLVLCAPVVPPIGRAAPVGTALMMCVCE